MESLRKLTILRGRLHETRHKIRAGMKLMPTRVFISDAGLSYCCVYMTSGRYKTFISGRHKNLMPPFHAGMENLM